MKILIKLNHPAHYHLFKNFANCLMEQEHDVIIVIKKKDILEDLLVSEKVNFITLIKSEKRISKNKYSVIKANIKELIKQDYYLLKLVRKEKPNLMFGTDTSIAHVGFFLKIPTFIFNEDDYRVNTLFCLFTYSFSKYIVSPKVCDVGNYTKKKIEYDGYQKLAYLHPNWFSPNENIVIKYFYTLKKYYLIRLVSFTAGHDIEKIHYGLTQQLLSQLIDILSKKGDVYITSESQLLPKFQKYHLRIDPKDIHHILAFADLFISDSQSMTVEAAMLGTPSIRFNSFVGKISVLEELEKKYGLTYGITDKNPKLLIEKVRQLIESNNLKEEFLKRRNKMLLDKIDLTNFMISLIKKR